MKKECSNCEASRLVTRWGMEGCEVPYFFVRRYPTDSPRDPGPKDGEPYDCPCCEGTGYRDDEW